MLSAFILVILANTAQASSKPEILQLIESAELEHNIPKGLLLAVVKIESNLNAFALNISGNPTLPKDKNAALEIVRESLDKGINNIDIGIAQINYKWHGSNFSSIEDMISPKSNIKYAARLLSQTKTGARIMA